MSLIYYYPEHSALVESLCRSTGFDSSALKVHHFPDSESLVTLDKNVKGKKVYLCCSLDDPDHKSMPLMFFAETAREMGALSVNLIAPYLGYMRQDKRFHEGEAISSPLFARFISQHFDSLITIDPHLHRYKSLDEIYTIPATLLHAYLPIANWIKAHIEKPFLIGPDEESVQWVSAVAKAIDAPYTVLEKTRYGDQDVAISVPKIEEYQDFVPVLVDDIISTARTMIETIRHLTKMNVKPPVCIGVHALFAGDAWENLKNEDLQAIVTCNTVPHPTNAIDLSDLIIPIMINK